LGVDKFYTENESKADYAERAIKNIKSRISRYRSHRQTNRWIDVLAEVTESYNKTYHRSMKEAPIAIEKRDQVSLWKIQHDIEPPTKKRSKGGPSVRYKFKVGNKVRISHLQTVSARIR
jgi:hypothetical protein